MHLSDEIFSKNKSKTMIPTKINKIIKPTGNLTIFDIREIHLLYECISNLEKHGMKKKKFKNVFRFLNLYSLFEI
jgi:hypothetical protein